MNLIIKLILEYQREKSDNVFEHLVFLLKDKIGYFLRNVPDDDKDDVRQEMLIGLYQLTLRFNFGLVFLDKSRFTEENLRKMTEKNFRNADEVMKQELLRLFLKKYGSDLFLSAFHDPEAREKWLYEYWMFCNEIQFIGYLNRVFGGKVSDYFRKRRREINSDVRLYFDAFSSETRLYPHARILSDEDVGFLKRFIRNGRVLSETEVGKQLGITQQAVNKRKKRIAVKYKIKTKQR